MATGKHKIQRTEDSSKGELVARDAALDPVIFKVSLKFKFLAFALTTITLSWFFEGCREIGHVSFYSVAMLLGGTVGTLALLGLQGYWIYIEEKLKGNLRKRIDIFEAIYERSSLYKRINGDIGEES